MPEFSRRILLGLAGSALFGAKNSIRKPALDGEPWQLFPRPDLGELNGPDPAKQHVVDHGFYQLPDGRWRLWACIRGTAVGRLLYGWEGESLERGGWKALGVMARASAEWGEGGAGTEREQMRAPYFLKIDGVYHLFYDSAGMRLMTSRDGLRFERKDLGGERRNLLYRDGGRDVMVLRIGKLWHAYSTVSTTDRQGYIILKTSPDLLEWSETKIVCRGGRGGSGPISAESPFVVPLDNRYYLFRASSNEPLTFVYASEDPAWFGVDDDRNLIAQLPVKAPEVFLHEGRWYISDLADFQGVRLRRLRWE